MVENKMPAPVPQSHRFRATQMVQRSSVAHPTCHFFEQPKVRFHFAPPVRRILPWAGWSTFTAGGGSCIPTGVYQKRQCMRFGAVPTIRSVKCMGNAVLTLA
jgi:hypothetical protein